MQTNFASIVQNIKLLLVKELCLNMQDEWLTECIKYFIQRDGFDNLNSLYDNVKDQLLLANIVDASNRVISEMFFTKKNCEWMFNDKLFLQMQFIVEICK